MIMDRHKFRKIALLGVFALAFVLTAVEILADNIPSGRLWIVLTIVAIPFICIGVFVVFYFRYRRKVLELARASRNR